MDRFLGIVTGELGHRVVEAFAKLFRASRHELAPAGRLEIGMQPVSWLAMCAGALLPTMHAGVFGFWRP